MNSECETCGSLFHGVDRDEDGAREVPGQKCDDEFCRKWICKAGCQELSFECDGWGHKFCESHQINFQSMRLCIGCLQETLEANEPPCSCQQTDVDLFDAADCDFHNDRSDFNRLMRVATDRERYEKLMLEVA